jgi:hypothetical protein
MKKPLWSVRAAVSCLRANAEMDRTLGYPQRYVTESAADYVRYLRRQLRRAAKRRHQRRPA